MFMIKKWIFLLAAVLIMTGTIQSQTSVTLQDALNYALNNSEVLRQARLDIDNAHEVVTESKAGALPQIGFNSSVTANPIVASFVLPAEAFGGAPGEFMAIKAGQTWTAMSQVYLSQQVYNQQIFTGLKAAKSSVEFYELANKISEENVIQQVAASFYQVLITKEKIEVIDANLDQVTQLEDVVRGQYENGLARKIDLDRLRVNKSNLQTQKLSLENAVGQQENLLKYYMGMPISEDIVLISSPIENIEISAAALTKDESVQVRNLFSFQALEKQQELLNFQKQAEIAKAYPTLSLDANYLFNTQSDKINLYTGRALNYDMSAINLTVSVPIFDGNARKSRIKQTELSIRKLEEEKRKTDNGLQMALENARKQMIVSLETIQSQQENNVLAEEVFFSTQNNYKNGLASLTDLLDAETQLLTAQNNYHEALLNYKIAEIELIKARGEIKSLLNE